MNQTAQKSAVLCLLYPDDSNLEATVQIRQAKSLILPVSKALEVLELLMLENIFHPTYVGPLTFGYHVPRESRAVASHMLLR